MAANKFATMVHQKSNKITLFLVYAMLEWILIALLLLNSLFSYLLIKFADYFGLKRPCILCSRLDHVFDPQKSSSSYRDLVCESHATEISKLSFCSRHGIWTESLGLCENCWTSVENGEMGSSCCSCCGGGLDANLYLGKLSWMASDKGKLISGGADDDDDDGDNEKVGLDWGKEKQGTEEIQIGNRRVEEVEEKFSCSVYNSDRKEDVIVDEEKQDRVKEEDDSVVYVDDQSGDHPIVEVADASSSQTLSQHLEFFIDQDDCRLIPVDDVIIAENPRKEEKGLHSDDLVFEFGKHFESQLAKKPKHAVFDSIEFGEYVGPSVLNSKGDLLKEECEQILAIEATCNGEDDVKGSTERAVENMGSDASQESDEALQLQNDEIAAEVSIGTEIPDQELIDNDMQHHYGAAPTSNDELSSKQAEEDDVEFKIITVETRELVMNNHLSFSSEIHESIEEDKIPDTPKSMDSLHHLHRKLLNSGTEDSLDGGSVLSDIEGGGDGVLTTEKLKSVLREERKALNALYAELEEERSASAVAASQTMAMINRLQEEKAAMQMEALQYQRMMEEQSEFDQEALQLLNDLMVKREREKAELEKEVQMYRKKVQRYEEKERMLSMKKKDYSPRSVTTSASCSNTEDSDELSIDFNHEAKEENLDNNHQEIGNQNTPPDAVLHLEESLANFEEERLSILEELKVLEEKLFTLDGDSDDEEHHIKPIEDSNHWENGNCNGNIEHIDYGNEVNGVIANGHYSKEMNGKHHQDGRIKAKRLLPLFDATDDAISEDGQSNGDAEGNKKLGGLEEEVEHVYERLQALEADREFLKHCITSLSKGDKGVYLLQEILQHLRDLRSVEIRVKSMENGVLH